MAGVRLSYSWSGLDRARAAVRYLRNLGEDTQPLLEIAGGIFEASTRDRFDTGRGPGGVPWPVSRRVKEKGGKTLVDKATLVSSIRHEVRQGEVEWGVSGPGASVKNAKVHQFGATIRPKTAPFLVFTAPDGRKVFTKFVTIPARPFLGVDAQDRDDVLDAWFDHIRGRLGAL